MHQHLHYWDPRRRRERKDNEKIFEERIAENFPNMGKEIVNQVQKAQSPSQCKPKEEHAKTHTKVTKTKHKERILKATRQK